MTPTYDRAAHVRELAAGFGAAILEHLTAVERRRGETDAAVFAAYDRLRDAFTAYEDALYEVYDEVTPFEVVEIEDEEDVEEDEEDEEELYDGVDVDELEDEPDGDRT